MPLTNEQVLTDLESKYSLTSLTEVGEPYGLLTLTIPVDLTLDILGYLKDHPTFDYVFLTDLCGVHYPNRTGEELGVVYHLHSLRHNHRIRLKTIVPVTAPLVPSASGLWLSANWMERETYDFYGIQFTGHPDLRRILNMDDMDYFPMRKEYPLEDPTRRDKVDEMFGR